MPDLGQEAPKDTHPVTSDPGVDAAVAGLAVVDPSDLDEILAAGEAVHVGLTARLSDLGS